jgi:hypothetical protein
MRKRSLHTKGLFGFALLAFVLVASGFFYGYVELAALKRQYTAQLQLVANNAIQSQQADVLQRTLEQSTDDRKKLKSYFLNVREVADLLADTERYMEQILVAGEVGGIVTQPANDAGIAAVSIPYTVTGTRTSVLQLLEFLETLPYHSAVTKFSMRGNKNSTQVDATITLQVSYIEYDRN